jgi:hypothetical protein
LIFLVVAFWYIINKNIKEDWADDRALRDAGSDGDRFGCAISDLDDEKTIS